MGAFCSRDDLESFFTPSGCLQPSGARPWDVQDSPTALCAHHPPGLGLA